ncbi:RraA family protein [Candidatus Latescibacterota bacterium]
MKVRKSSFMLFLVIILSVFLHSEVINAQFGTFSSEELIEYTKEWTGERFPDGRPKVPDRILELMKEVSITEAWTILSKYGYDYQHEFMTNEWINLHPDRAFVGRAFTGFFMPHRPDVDKITREKGKAAGIKGDINSWVIDPLVENDCMVIDIYGRVDGGDFMGDNLANAVYAKSKSGAVIDGAVRDMEGIYDIPGFNAFIRGHDPAVYYGIMLMGINVPVQIGRTIVMPGDVVLGRRDGIIFIPPHLAEAVVESSIRAGLRDEWGHMRLREKKYPAGDVDGRWTEEMKKDYEEWEKNRLKK